MTTETKLTRQSPVGDLWLAIAQQPGFEGLRVTCDRCSRETDWANGMPQIGVYVCQGNREHHSWSGCGNCGGMESCASLTNIGESARGRGWTVNQDRDALEACVRERGWQIQYATMTTWDQVFVRDIHSLERLGESQTEGLRGGHAEVLAVAQGLGLVEAA